MLMKWRKDMIWDIFFVLGGVLSWIIVQKKFDTKLNSIIGIGTIVIIFFILELIKYLVASMI